MMNSTQISYALNKLYPPSTGVFVNLTIHLLFALAYSTLLLILCVIFRNLQPLKSRGILPAMAALFTMVVAAFGLLNSLLRRVGATSDLAVTCMIGITLTFTVLYVCFIVVQIVQLTRFLLLQNASFERLKLISLTSKSNTRKAREAAIKKIRVYRCLLSPAIPVVLLAATAILLIPLCALGFTYDFITMKKQKVSYFYLVSGVSYLSSSVVVVLVALIDVIKNIKTFCPLHKYLINKDRLLFRVETLFGIFAITVWALIEVLHSNVSSTETWYIIVMTVLDVIKQFIFTTYICGGIPLLVVIITKVSAIKAKKALKAKVASAPAATTAPVEASPTTVISEGDELGSLLSDEQGIKLLEEFVQAEYSVENLECWKALQNIKAADQSKRRTLFLKLFNVFIKEGAPLQVNITAEVKQGLEQLQIEVSTPSLVASTSPSIASLGNSSPLDQSEPQMSSSTYDLTSSSPAHQVDLAKLNDLESGLCMNLRDSFIRLKQTYAYSNFVQGQKEKAEMLKKMNFV